MFLTTNRVTQLDGAIRMMLTYDDLSKTTGKKVWKRFIERANTSKGPANISSKELDLLVNSKLNGRQIRVF
jgi:hypothetical protein